MSTPCFQHDSYHRGCGDCRDMNGDDEPTPTMTSPDAQAKLKAPELMPHRCLAALDRIRSLLAHARTDAVDLVDLIWRECDAAFRTPDAQPSSVETVPVTIAKCDGYGRPIPGEFVTVGTVEIEIEREPSSTEGEVERAWHEGWSTGYRSGTTDGGSDSCWCDEEGDWEKSAARAAIAAQVTK